jgi:cytochrome P450
MEPALGERLVPPDLETAGRLPYLDAIASEAMRLHPVAPLIGLETIEDVIAGDVMLPRGTWITLLTRPPAVASENFAEPTEFKPERWLASEPHPGAHVRGAAIAFGSGPRICPGRHLAMLEMRVVLAALLASFDIERAGHAGEVRERFSFTMFPEGLRVILHPRERHA